MPWVSGAGSYRPGAPMPGLGFSRSRMLPCLQGGGDMAGQCRRLGGAGALDLRPPTSPRPLLASRPARPGAPGARRDYQTAGVRMRRGARRGPTFTSLPSPALTPTWRAVSEPIGPHNGMSGRSLVRRVEVLSATVTGADVPNEVIRSHVELPISRETGQVTCQGRCRSCWATPG